MTKKHPSFAVCRSAFAAAAFLAVALEKLLFSRVTS
jgi:hypothetical protein